MATFLGSDSMAARERKLAVGLNDEELEVVARNGRYLFPPDLLVERADRQLLEEVVSDLIENDLLKDEWLVEPVEDDE